MKNHAQEIEKAVKQFRKKVDAIRNSDNPYYKDKDVQNYEIKQHQAELDATVAELSHEFDVSIAQEIEQAEAKAKTARFYTTETAKQQSEWALDSYITDVVMARYEADKYEAYRRFEERLNTMDEGALAHIRLKLPQAMSRVNGDEIARKDLMKVNDSLAKLNTPEQLRVDELKAQKSAGVVMVYSRLKMTHPAYRHLQSNQHNAGFNNGVKLK
ncbi:hypothetical protein [Planococcus sp. S3-L1]|uniref:hypothetical protein n=1 Tax=Planococcus sp. S3-L1 TaxID=3046200 RepID=UPI0024BB28E1|nr:hypothetical protein [Planococcus sp. S3-L1]MDJ0332114.1 hypothetical protein [Planococcus sp. S3-L1]